MVFAGSAPTKGRGLCRACAPGARNNPGRCLIIMLIQVGCSNWGFEKLSRHSLCESCFCWLAVSCSVSFLTLHISLSPGLSWSTKQRTQSRSFPFLEALMRWLVLASYEGFRFGVSSPEAKYCLVFDGT